MNEMIFLKLFNVIKALMSALENYHSRVFGMMIVSLFISISFGSIMFTINNPIPFEWITLFVSTLFWLIPTVFINYKHNKETK